MKKDAVERELVVCGRYLRSLGESFGALAAELRRERKNGSLSITRGREATSQELSEIRSQTAEGQTELFEGDCDAGSSPFD